MASSDDLSPSLASAVTLLRERLAGLKLAYCFGSVARAEDRPDSDIDLAVLLDRRLDPLEVLDLRRELATLVGREVDLVDLRRAPSALKAQVIDGLVLFEVSRFMREDFEARTLSEFVRLNEARRGILDDIYARGALHD